MTAWEQVLAKTDAQSVRIDALTVKIEALTEEIAALRAGTPPRPQEASAITAPQPGTTVSPGGAPRSSSGSPPQP